MKYVLLTALAISFKLVCSQTDSIYFDPETAPENWYNMDLLSNKIPGVGTERAYKQILQGKTAEEVIVAVIDSGVDVDHEDLKESIWVNADEIEGNGIDDDGNGYIDDVNGWNFIGGVNGDVEYDNLEFTRVFKSLKDKYETSSGKGLAKNEKEEFARYVSMKKQYESRVSAAEEEAQGFNQLVQFYEMSKQNFQIYLGKNDFTIEEVKAYETEEERKLVFKEVLVGLMEIDFESQIEEGMRHFNSLLNNSYNLDLDTREIVGDDYSNINERNYGNNRVMGPKAEHGTHVAGIIAAQRNNGLGTNGISADAKIMVLRVVPDGDERDKDIISAIHYAVDNGAKIINMSFGKSYSPNKVDVDKAVQYAESKGVVMIHASGNSSRNNDKSNNFPNPVDEITRERCKTWIEVGASGWDLDQELIANFSNYGRKSVDVFAPGVDIYSTVPGSEYKNNSGTSMAAPVVSGVAALVWSYYPDLKGEDIKEIIVNSYQYFGDEKVLIPGHKKGKSAKFKKLSKTGGVVNAFNALKMAEEYSKKAG